jgi:hypothetical protein
MRDVRDETEAETKYIDFLKGDDASRMLDLLPGQYIIGITYSHSSGGSFTRALTLGDKSRLKISTEAGNIYIIYPLLGEKKWQPVIVNINDYIKEECKKHIKYVECPDKEEIRKRAQTYLQGERPIMTFHPLSETPHYTPATEEAKRDIKGFWW